MSRVVLGRAWLGRSSSPSRRASQLFLRQPKQKRKSPLLDRPWYGVEVRDRTGGCARVIYTSRTFPARMALQPQRYHLERRKLYQQVRPCALRTGKIATSRKAGGKLLFVHRLCYIAFFGPIPEGKEIDHLC